MHETVIGNIHRVKPQNQLANSMTDPFLAPWFSGSSSIVKISGSAPDSQCGRKHNPVGTPCPRWPLHEARHTTREHGRPRDTTRDLPPPPKFRTSRLQQGVFLLSTRRYCYRACLLVGRFARSLRSFTFSEKFKSDLT